MKKQQSRGVRSKQVRVLTPPALVDASGGAAAVSLVEPFVPHQHNETVVGDPFVPQQHNETAVRDCRRRRSAKR